MTNLSEWIEAINRLPHDPDRRFALVAKLKSEPSPFADFLEQREKVARTTSDTLAEATLLTISQRGGFVSFIEELDVRYVNPGGSSTIGAKNVALVTGPAKNKLAMFPPRLLRNWMCDIYGPFKPKIVTRDIDTLLLLHPDSVSASAESFAYDIYVRAVVRYEPKELCKAMGLIDAKNFPDSDPPLSRGIAGRR